MGSSSTGLRPGRLFLLYGGIVFLLFLAVPTAVYLAFDPERLDLNDSARRVAAVRGMNLLVGFQMLSALMATFEAPLLLTSKARRPGAEVGSMEIKVELKLSK